MTFKMTNSRRLLAVTPVLACLVLAACGSDDDEADSTTTAAAAPASSAAPSTAAAPNTTAATASTAAAPAGGEVIEVVATDYAFGGIPETVAPGTRFSLTNASDKELHELVVVRIVDGETRPIDELVTLPEEELATVIVQGPPTMVQLAFPGSDEPIPAVGDGTVSEPGRYAVVCFIPEGADPEAYMEAAEQSGDGPPPADPNAGPPHVALGMFAEFTVEG